MPMRDVPAFQTTGSRRLGAVAVWVLLLAGTTGPAEAQRPEDRSRYGEASYYSYVEAGQTPITVNVWGTVRNPGLYEVSDDTRLSTLVSAAGGPLVAARDRRERRAITLRLTRSGDGAPRVVYETVMQDGVFAAEDDPLLEAGDTLTVDTVLRQEFSWRDALPIVSTVASVALAIAYFLTN